MNQHDTERTEDKADRNVVKETLFGDTMSLHFLLKIVGAGITVVIGICISIMSWVLVKQYDLNATVAVQGSSLNTLYNDVEGTPGNPGMKAEVNQIYMSRGWRDQQDPLSSISNK